MEKFDAAGLYCNFVSGSSKKIQNVSGTQLKNEGYLDYWIEKILAVILKKLQIKHKSILKRFYQK